LQDLATRLVRDPGFYSETVADSQQRARELLTFDTVCRQLARFFESLAR
jgi:hypothetical protein